jgi:hypothetical protein
MAMKRPSPYARLCRLLRQAHDRPTNAVEREIIREGLGEGFPECCCRPPQGDEP